MGKSTRYQIYKANIKSGNNSACFCLQNLCKVLVAQEGLKQETCQIKAENLEEDRELKCKKCTAYLNG